MDEADYLGDRIGIMSSGGLVTQGSSMFLKNKFGVGYILNIIKETEDRGQTIMDKILEIVPGARLSSDYGLEMKIQLQRDDEENFEELFTFLETEGETIGVKEFGISLTTLEDVFLKVGNLFDEDALEDNKTLFSNAEGGGNEAEAKLKKILEKGTSLREIGKPRQKTVKELGRHPLSNLGSFKYMYILTYIPDLQFQTLNRFNISFLCPKIANIF